MTVAVLLGVGVFLLVVTCGYWELSPGLLEEQPVLLTVELSLQPNTAFLTHHLLCGIAVLSSHQERPTMTLSVGRHRTMQNFYELATV